MEKLLSKGEIESLVEEYGERVSMGKDIKKLIEDGEIPRLESCIITVGKVSDSVYGKNLKTKDSKPIRLMFRTSRISTHNKNRGVIPFKDQVVACNHNFMLELVKEILGSSQFEIPNLKPNCVVVASENLDMIKMENVLRFYMAKSSTSTSLYQNYRNGKRIFCGHKLNEGLKVNEKLPYIMDTPTTKDLDDKSVTQKYLIKENICTKEEYIQIRNSSIMAYGVITNFLKNRGLVLVDTKTEHGRNSNGRIVVADEVYTLDSSRFWKIDNDGEIQVDKDGNPVSFSKEFAREIFDENKTKNFTKEQSNKIAVRYIMSYQYLTGKRFVPDLRTKEKRIIESVNLILDYLLE